MKSEPNSITNANNNISSPNNLDPRSPEQKLCYPEYINKYSHWLNGNNVLGCDNNLWGSRHKSNISSHENPFTNSGLAVPQDRNPVVLTAQNPEVNSLTATVPPSTNFLRYFDHSSTDPSLFDQTCNASNMLNGNMFCDPPSDGYIGGYPHNFYNYSPKFSSGALSSYSDSYPQGGTWPLAMSSHKEFGQWTQ